MASAYDKALMMKRHNWSGVKYEELVSKIITDNHKKIAERVLSSDKRLFESNLKKIQPKFHEMKVRLPDVSNVIRRSPTIIKAADRGKLVMKTLRDKMRRDVKRAMLDNGINNVNGTVNKNVVRSLRKNLRETFSGYTATKGMTPSEVDRIATTETMDVANNVRHEYAKQVNQDAKADGFVMEKRWQHNKGRKNMPRQSHLALHGIQIGLEKFFTIEDEEDGVFYAEKPYDNNLPASQRINCHCSLLYVWVKLDNATD